MRRESNASNSSSVSKGSKATAVGKGNNADGKRKDSVSSGMKVNVDRKLRGSRASLDSKVATDRDQGKDDNESVESNFDGVARTQFKSGKRG